MSWVKPLKPTPGCIGIENSFRVILSRKKEEEEEEEEEEEGEEEEGEEEKEEEAVHGYNPTLVHGHHNTIYPQQ